jgi:ABC-type molybdate transport system permease subunit
MTNARQNKNIREKSFLGPTIEEIAKTRSASDICRGKRASLVGTVIGVVVILQALFLSIAKALGAFGLLLQICGAVAGSLCVVFCVREFFRFQDAKRLQENSQK